MSSSVIDDDVFWSAFVQGRNIPPWPRHRTGIWCCFCGQELLAYYCEKRLYAVSCDACKTVTLTEARGIKDAAYRARAFKLSPAEEIGEEPAVFWLDAPVIDPPEYVGSTADCNYPDCAAYGMRLPVPGTDGSEYKKKE